MEHCSKMTPKQKAKKAIGEMPVGKRAGLEGLAADEGMTLVEYLIDLYSWSEVAQPGNVIVVKNSTTGDIIQNG
jgi:hypothetical protein